MAVKSIIDVDINDEKFTRFKELFDRYQEALARQPGMWKDVNEQSAILITQFERLAAALLAQGQVARENDEGEKQRLTRLQHSEKLWASIGKNSAHIAKNVLDIGAGVLKWGALLAGGLVGGGLFGLDHLGAAAADQRRSSKGLGLSVGEQKAFETDFGRFVNPGAFLSGINEAVSDVSKQGPLRGLGVNPNQSTAKVAIDTLEALRALSLSTPDNLLGTTLHARGLDAYTDLESFRRLGRGTPAKEFNQQIARYAGDVSALGFSDSTGKAWQDFTTQMERAGQTIEKVLIDKLSPLAGPLTNLSNSVIHAFERFADGGAIKTAIDATASWFDRLSSDIAKPEFLNKIEQFTSDVGALGDVVHGLADVADHPAKAVGKLVWEDFTKGNVLRWKGIEALFGIGNDTFAQRLATLDLQEGLPAGFLERQKLAESGTSMSPPNSSKGAVGVFQFMPDTARAWGVDPTDPESSAYGAARYDHYLINKYKGDLAATLAAYNYGEGNFDKLRAAHPKDWQNYLPAETRDYLAKQLNVQPPGVNINVFNNTGGNANTAVSAFTP